MSWWRVKSPEMFISSFLDAMKEGEGVDKLLFVSDRLEDVRGKQREFRLFRYCLREQPSHKLHWFEVSFSHRTRIRRNHMFKRWELLLTSRNLLTDIMEITENVA